MIILLDLYGRTSNHLIQHVRFDSFCKEYGIKFYNIPIARYLNDFPNLELYSKSKLLARVVQFIFFVLNRFSLMTYLDFNDPETGREYSQKPEFFKGKIVFCRGWNLHQPKLLTKYRKDYQRQMQPKVDEIKLSGILERSSVEQVLIGVHIRREDYIEYRGGNLYFDDVTYLNYVQQLITLVNKPAKVIIFTNDKVLDLAFYEHNLDCVVLSKYNVAEDYYLMMRCDYLISTISTFPQWASYIGGVKLHRVSTTNEILTMDSFVEVDIIKDTQDYFTPIASN